MSATSRSRPKRKSLEPITVEELADTAGMSGFCTFLTRQADVPVPILDEISRQAAVNKQELLAPTIEAPEVVATEDTGDPNSREAVGNMEAPEVVASSLVAPAVVHDNLLRFPGLIPPHSPLPRRSTSIATNQVAPEVASITDEPQVAVEQFDLTPYSRSSFEAIFRPRPIRDVQDALTANELKLLMFLWNNGSPLDREGNCRVFSIGDRALANALQIAYSTIRGLTTALHDKLALEVRPGKPTGGKQGAKIFVIFGFGEILRRWRKAGWTLYLRLNGTRALCDASGTVVAPKVVASNVLRRAMTVIAPGVDFVAPIVEAPKATGVATIVEAPNSNQLTPLNEPPAAELRAVVDIVSRHLSTCDDDLARKLIAQSRTGNMNAPIDEVLCWIDITLHDLCRNPRIDSKAGVLLSRATQAFTGEGYASLQALTPKWRKSKAEEIMQRHSTASPEERHWAENVLFGDSAPESVAP
jgi:hypothetical protein